MARKKAPPKRAPEYEKPKAKKKSPPGKAKDGSKCFTRTNKGGAAYVTCEGSQKKAKAKASLKSGGPPPVMTKKKAPAKPKPKSTIGGYSGQKVKVGTLNKGSLNLTKPKPKAEPSQVKSAWTFFEKKFKGIGPSEHLKEHKVELNKDGTYNVYEYPMVSGDFEKSRKLVGKINSKDISFRRGTKAMDDTTAIIGEVKSAKAKPSISKDDYLDVSSIIATRNKQRIAEKPKLTAAQIRAKEYRENFRYDVGDKVSFQTGRHEKAKVIAGTIEALTDKGVVMRANKGEVEKSVNRGFNFSVSYTWRPTEGTQKKVVSWGRVRGVQEYSGKSVSLGRVGG